MSQGDVIKYLEKEMISSIKEIVEFMEEVSPMAVHKSVGKLVKHNEIIKFKIGLNYFYCVPEIKEEFMEIKQ